MSDIVEANEYGDIILPHGVVRQAKPHGRYRVEQEGNTLKLVPVEEELQKTAEEHIRSFLDWVNSPRPPVPDLPDEALRRESMYD
ncbi:MAG: hypothetical protein HYX78_01380 [Armatimonadetes bacterium]|nr:hypothetical protein [Armatimonadota bacterium]